MFEVIDAHGHFVPSGLHDAVRCDPLLRDAVTVTVLADGSEALRFPGIDWVRPMPRELNNPDMSLDWLDNKGIGRQIVGPWSDLFGYQLDSRAGERWCKVVNDLQIQELEHTARLIPLGILPLQSPTLAAAEVNRTADLGFKGVTIGCRVGELDLDDPQMDVVWATLAERGLPVVMHPAFHAHEARTSDLGLPNTIGRPHDTDIAVARLVLSGTLVRHPGSRLFLMHGGGSIPLLWGRLQRNHAISPETTDPELSIGRIWVDSVVYRPEAVKYLVETVGEDHVLLGSDYPFPIMDPEPREVVENSALSPAIKDKILGGNASTLFDL